MKKVVNGKLYDTDKSQKLFTDPMTKRIIYRTEKGSYFILYPNKELVPKTEDEIKEYIGLHDADLYIRLFGEVEEA
jgi:hypothetical protein